MTPALDHQYFESGPSYGGESSDLVIPESSFFDFPLFPQLSQNDNNLTFEPRSYIPQPLDLSRAGNTRFGSIEEDWASPESSTPYDHSFYTGAESGWMQGAYSPNPRLRVQQSTPNSASSPATPPPMNAGGNWAPIDWSNIPSQAYLSPTTQNFNSPQQTFRGHKRLSSGSSAASAEPNSPYIQSSVYPQIVDADNLSASSPHLEAYDTGLQQASSYEKPLYYQQSPLNSVSFVQPFENLNLANDNSYEVMARRNQALQERHAATSGQVSVDQANMNRSFPRSDTANGGGNLMVNTMKLDRTDSDALMDELYVPQNPPTQAQMKGRVNQQSHAPSNSAVNHRLQQAQATRAQQQASRSLTPSTEVSRDSPFSDFGHGNQFQMSGGNYRATNAGQVRERQSQTETSQQQQQRQNLSSTSSSSSSSHQQQQQDLTHDHFSHNDGAGVGSAAILIKPEDLDSTRPTATQVAGVAKTSNTRTPNRNEPSGFAAEPSFVNPLQSSVSGITDGNSGHHNTIQAHYAATSARNRNNLGPPNFYDHQQSQPTTNLLSQVDPLNMASSNGASAGAAAYPFISSNRRQSTSTRSEQNEPTFPPSLPSMESTRSESSREPNVRPPVFTRQDTSTSTQRSEVPSPRTTRPANTSANTGRYHCPVPGCNGRFSDGRRLQEHRRANHPGPVLGGPPQASTTRTSEDAASARTSSTSTSSSTPRINPQAEINNQSRNSAPGPHRCQRNNPTTGRVCGAVFSRSYDLVRHEDTIHSSNRPRIRCEHCPEEKTFSRSDALTRHMRVVHPEINDTTTTRNRRRG